MAQPQSTTTCAALGYYCRMGPEATKLHKAYLAARRAKQEAYNEYHRTLTRVHLGDAPAVDLEAARQRYQAAHDAMVQAQTAAAYAPRGI